MTSSPSMAMPLPAESGRTSAFLPAGKRVYCIGDVHGRHDLLRAKLDAIDADLRRRPATQPLVVCLGDYVDRGPDSRSVLEELIQPRDTFELVCLAGNHEKMLLRFLEEPGTLSWWAKFGGLDTLRSYGIEVHPGARPEATLALALRAALPRNHIKFLFDLKTYAVIGGYLFVHAGIRPGVPVAAQHEKDLLWIREEFLLHSGPFEKLVVHGHTPVRAPEVHHNRINIDTAAFATGRLTCLVLEDNQYSFL